MLRYGFCVTPLPAKIVFVQDGKNGFLVPLKNPEAIAEAALRLGADYELLLKMGEASRNIVLDRFAKDRVLKQYLEVYKSI